VTDTLNAAALQLVDEGPVRRVAEDHVPPAAREFQDRAVLRDDDVDAGQIACHSTKIRQPASGDEGHDDAVLARGGHFPANRRIEDAVARDRPVVVKRQRGQFHRGSSGLIQHASGCPPTTGAF